MIRDYKLNPLKIVKRKYEYPYKEDLEELYITRNLKKREICEYLNISETLLKKILKEYNIQKPKKEILKDELYDLYYIKKLSRKDVAKYFGVYETTITTYCRKYGFEIKSQSDKIATYKNTIKSKYGVVNYFQTNECKDKIKQTCLKKYGVDNYQSTDDFKQKVKLTKLERYGNENYNNICKNKQTCLERYGVDNATKKHDKIEYYDILNSYEKTIEYIKENNIINVRHLAMTMGMKEGYVQKIINEYDLKQMFDYSKSRYELEIQNLIPSSFNMKKNYKYNKLKELDIYIPELKLGIEINGNYWHSEDVKGKYAQYNKSKELNDIGIFVYHIFEYEWVNKKDKIINQLNNLLCINQEKIYARKCIIKEITTKEKNIFLEENHLQGRDKCNIAFGLLYNNELVSVMTFTKPRFNKKYEWELSRYASKANCNVIGGASKLFNYFIKTYNPKNILSYSDIAKTKGNLYQLLGFELNHISEPNYIWIKRNNDYKTRYQCQKHKLLKQGYNGETEIEIMTNLGYYRLYDCGNKVWVWDKNKNNEKIYG